MELFDAIDQRVSARLSEPGPGAEALERILAAGVRAPDHGRLAPWRFVVLEGEARSQLGDAMAARLRRVDPTCTDEQAAMERGKVFRAPLIVVVAAQTVAHPKVPEAEQVMAVAACVQNMSLAATGLGFAANWKTGPAARDDGVKRALGLDAAAVVVAFLYLGTPAAAMAARPARLDGLVRRL
jgi:nitroreductase